MNAGRTARERARTELTRQIKEHARAQLAEVGAHGLSLRAVARDLGMVSSAMYRYFASRDDLLTALIVDAYDALGTVAETANRPAAGPRDRWRAVCLAVRDWARANPHEYALIYGSPVPGYQAPQDTVPPATRTPLVMIGILRDAWTDGALRVDADPQPPLLTKQLAGLAAAIAPDVPAAVLGRGLVALSQLFGMISFELFGQFVGSVDPSDEFVAYAVERMADFVGLA